MSGTGRGAAFSGARRALSLSAPFHPSGLLELLKHAYDQPSWHGANLREALEGVSLEEALWRPALERHNIWELVLHCAYWKHVVIRRLGGFGDDEGFPRSPKDFPALPEATRAAWEADLGFLDDTHRQLLAAVGEVDDARLDDLIADSETRTVAETIFGVANHDIYHAGQIRLLLTLQQGAA